MSCSAWVTLGKIYTVLEIFVGGGCEISFRILTDDRNSPGLQPASQFEIVSTHVPREWQINFVSGSHLEMAPGPWLRDGFWEDYFNGESEAKRIFSKVAQSIIEQEI